MLPCYSPCFQQHNTIIISQKNRLVKRKVVESNNFCEIYKKILLSFYKLPIEKGVSMCYNKDTKEVQSNVQVSQTSLFQEVRSNVLKES